MGNSFGTLFKISTWGESHGGGIGVVIDGCPLAFLLLSRISNLILIEGGLVKVKSPHPEMKLTMWRFYPEYTMV